MKPFLLIVLLTLFFQLSGQQSHRETILKINEPIKIDGVLNESVWQNHLLPKQGKQFIQSYPYDTSIAKTKTNFLLAHDDKYIYAAFICENRNPKKPFVIQNLKRDFSVTTNDAVVLSLSPFVDGQNGFSFGITPYNAQREGAIENGGGMGVTTAWDQVWHSKTSIHDSFWIAEVAIPFSSIRYVRGSNTWTFNVSRIDLKNNEISNFARVPRNYNISTLVFADTLHWEFPVMHKPRNLVLIPYVSSISSNSAANQPLKTTPKFGMDAKIGVTPSLNLDLTVNPDFAQVDVDVQQLNLTRYNLYYPERRQFFIENSDLFANFGFRQIRPFFSRRIGLRSGGGIVPILYGARLSGKLGKKLRIGMMNLGTSHASSTATQSEVFPVNYSVFALQRKVFSASNIGLIWVNDLVQNPSKPKDYNSVLGLEYNLTSKDNVWNGKAFIQKSFYPGQPVKSIAHASWLLYKNLKWMLMWNHEYVNSKFSARTGFVPRTDNYNPITGKTIKFDYWRLEPQVKRIFYPSMKSTVYKLNNYSYSIYNSSYYDSSRKITESYTEAAIEQNFQNSAFLSVSIEHEYYRLFLPFSPVTLPQKGYFTGVHSWRNLHIEFYSSTRKALSCSTEFIHGGYFNKGNKTEYIGNITFRLVPSNRSKLPKWLFNANFRHVNMDLKDSGKYAYDLLGLKVEHSFNTITYLTGYWQVNTQTKGMNLNLRFQWRYRPMSDLFVVFTQNWNNQFITPRELFNQWNPLGKSLAAKWVYWF